MPPPPSLMLPPSQPPSLVPAGGHSVLDARNRVKPSVDGHEQAAPIAIRLTKAGLAQGSRGGFEVALQWEALAQPVTMATADIREGIQARRKHRPPAFDGS